MEAVGLAISAISLASLFTECIECLDLIEVARSSERHLNTQVCKFNIIKRQFMVWGESVGLLSPDEGRHSILDQIEGHREIKNALQEISVLFRDVEELKNRYGVDLELAKADESTGCLEISKRRKDFFRKAPLVEFFTRLAIHQRKSTIITKTRWAIRDSKKFEAFVETLDWFVTKLINIEVSHETHLRREMAVREEVESIVDLPTLTTMEQVCRGSNRSWAAAARIQSDHVSSGGSAFERNEQIRRWNAQVEEIESESQITNMDEGRRVRRLFEPLFPSRSTTLSTQSDPPLMTLKKPSILSRLNIR